MLKWFFGANLFTKVDRLSTYAAALAYCFVLSLVPFLIVTFVVGTRIAMEFDLNKHYSEHYAEVLGNIIPSHDQAQAIIKTVTSVESSKKQKGWLFAIGFLVAIYTSYNLMDQIVRTLLFIFDDPRRPQEWSWTVVLKTIGLLMVWMCLLLLISVSAVEAAILRHVFDSFHWTIVGRAIATASQVLITIAALFGTFYLTYYLVPVRSHKSRYILEGSLLASSGWMVCSLVFAKIMPSLLQTSAAYLALGSVVAILLWAQACAWSIIVGACWIVRFSPASPRTK
jgi:YihY family inner membrane protein